MGDRVAVLRDGRLQQVGTPREVYELPANRFVAGFVGSPAMNMVRAEVQPKGGGVLLRMAGQVLEWPAGPGASPPPPGPLVLGFRPLSVRLGRGPGLGPLRARLRIREYLGGTCLLHLDAGGARITVESTPETGGEPGGEVPLFLDPGALVGFDVTSGERVWAARDPGPSPEAE